jgi:protein-S-isoprenylcysteine O-methyltransferase Ste14
MRKAESRTQRTFVMFGFAALSLAFGLIMAHLNPEPGGRWPFPSWILGWAFIALSPILGVAAWQERKGK